MIVAGIGQSPFGVRPHPRVHYAEQGDADGETILVLPAYGDSWFS
jgi:hypothetical protein